MHHLTKSGSSLPTKGGTLATQAAAFAVEIQQYLSFVVAGETYAIGILDVKEILEYVGVGRVPMMPPTIRGIINLRGKVVPVIDLGVRFGGMPTEPSRRTCIVIVEVETNGERHDMGVMVDAVNEVLDISSENIEPPPTFGTTIRTDFIRGMGRVGERFVILLDVKMVLSVEELSQIHALMSAH
ncbi:purine-binding chemotaxis protein CheW [Gammaproteobacteria bacterium]